MPDMLTALQGGYADAYKDMIGPREEPLAQYASRTPWNVAMFKDQRLPSWLAGTAQNAYDAYQKWEPSWSDIPTIASALAEGVKGNMLLAGDTAQLYDDNAADMAASAGLELALEAAGGGFGASKLAGVPKGSIGMFAGTNAKTVNPKALKLAKQMESAGASRDEIWKATGEQFGQPWMNDAKGGGWKFEIDDSGLDINPKLRRDGGQMYGWTGRDLPHEELYDAYPNIGEIDSKLTIDGFSDKPTGSYRGRVSRKDEGLFDIMPELHSRGAEHTDVRSVGGHELQHAVQDVEGFARGGSQGDAVSALLADRNAELLQISKAMDARQKEIGLGDMYRPKTDDPTLLELRQRYDFLQETNPATDEATYDWYKRLAGEAEARNVQTRMDYPMQQRINEAPWTTLDVPEDELIYRMRVNGKSMSDALTDLPMDEASRMARADEMFPIDAYHGTAGEDFSAFRNQAGKPSLPVDGATWFSKQPSPASYIAQSRMESAGQDAGRIIPARLRMDNPLIVDAQGKHAVDVKGIKDAASRGYDGVILNNVREFGSDELTTSYGIFDPKNIRSRFAAFDPARKESANILAGIAGGAVVTPAMIEAFLSENEGQY